MALLFMVLRKFFYLFVSVDYSITKKAFGFPSKNNMPFFFVSASDGTNVVQVNKLVFVSPLHQYRRPVAVLTSAHYLTTTDCY